MISTAQGRLEHDPAAHPAAASWLTHCLNCGERLAGPFCSACGQRAVPPHPSLHELLHDALHEFAHVDGKIAGTVRSLVTSPGALTCHVLEGRRARYISPIRLYLTCSLIYFVLAAASPIKGSSISVSVVQPGTPRVRMAGKTAGLTEEERRQILAATDQAPRLIQPLMRRVVEDPRGLQRDIFNAWPKALFVLLPLFAFILVFFYPTRNFPEHLYFALHLHAFAFLAMSLSALTPFTHSTIVATVVGVGVLIWIPVYAHLAFRRVYGDSQVVTMLKETGVGVLYGLASIPAIFITALWVASHPH